MMKTCPHCRCLTVEQYGKHYCLNENCELNREAHVKRERAETIGTGIGLALNIGCLAALVALAIGALYGLHLLVSS